jgi:t-SNARE complex subunit (syntaxin)
MWTVIYIAQSAKQSEQIRDRLMAEGFLVKVRQTNVSKQQYEILVPEAELDEVQEVLNDVLHSSYDHHS